MMAMYVFGSVEMISVLLNLASLFHWYMNTFQLLGFMHVCVCVGGGGTTGTCDIQIILVKPFKSSTPGGAGMGHTPWLASVR